MAGDWQSSVTEFGTSYEHHLQRLAQTSRHWRASETNADQSPYLEPDVGEFRYTMLLFTGSWRSVGVDDGVNQAPMRRAARKLP
jgi:hypothetical protein